MTNMMEPGQIAFGLATFGTDLWVCFMLWDDRTTTWFESQYMTAYMPRRKTGVSGTLPYLWNGTIHEWHEHCATQFNRFHIHPKEIENF